MAPRKKKAVEPQDAEELQKLKQWRDTPSCEHCIYMWYDEEGDMTCRRNPPNMQMDEEGNFHVFFVFVHKELCCGEYVTKMEG